MSEQIRQLVDIDDRFLNQIRFGRNRFLRMLGVTLFGLATRMAMPKGAVEAAHYAVPWPCFGFGRCHSCSGSTCTESGCSPLYNVGCPNGSSTNNCWYTVVYCAVYRCCDFSSSTGPCICRQKTCNCC